MTEGTSISEYLEAGMSVSARFDSEDHHVWGVGWAWVEEAARYPVPGGPDDVTYDVRARFFAPTVDVCELVRAFVEDDQLEGTLTCGIIDDGEAAVRLALLVELDEVPDLRFVEPMLELQFMATGGTELLDFLDRRYPPPDPP